MREVSALIDLNPAADTPEGERLEVLGMLVQAYETKHHSIDPRGSSIGKMLADRNRQSLLAKALLKFDHARHGGEFPVAGRD